MGRVIDGFSTLEGGVSDGQSPSLIDPNQCSFACNLTFRGGYATTRPPWVNQVITFADDTTQANFNGKVQGICGYENPTGENGWVISRGGRLFFLNRQTFMVNEITPKLALVTGQGIGLAMGVSFFHPAPGAQVVVPVNNSSILTVNEVVKMDGGTYTVNTIAGNQVTMTYTSGAAHAQVNLGTPVLDSGNVPLYDVLSNPAAFDFIYLYQAENYVIILAGQNPPVFYNGSSAVRASTTQLPPGVFGIYVWGRNWIALPNRRNFVAGDLVGSSSGTPSLGYVDAILNMTENTFLNGGGAFTMPLDAGLISGMAALANLDSSLGIGNLLVGASKSVVSVNTPVDRTTWQNLTFPIQTISLLKYGPTGPRFQANSNGDLWFRSRDGLRSFKATRRSLNEPGNTPQSFEVSKLLAFDDPSMLFYGSANLFDNRLMFTLSPQRTTQGISHRGLIILNNDELSGLSKTLPPAYEGLWTGLNTTQIITTQFNDTEEGWLFALNGTTLELWQMGTAGYYDLYNDGLTVTRTPIQTVLESRSMPYGDGDQLKTIDTAVLYLDDLVDTVTLNIYYRPDQYPNWTLWQTITLCADVSQCVLQPPTATCQVWTPRKNTYAARIRLAQPEPPCNELNDKPMTWGYEHQFRIEGTGHFRLRKFKVFADTQPDDIAAGCETDEEKECKTVSGCDVPIFAYDSHGT